jgi:hypothetical protein
MPARPDTRKLTDGINVCHFLLHRLPVETLFVETPAGSTLVARSNPRSTSCLLLLLIDMIQQ